VPISSSSTAACSGDREETVVRERDRLAARESLRDGAPRFRGGFSRSACSGAASRMPAALKPWRRPSASTNALANH
jgi:hypothetical protein